MKRVLWFFVVFVACSGFGNLVNAQNVGVTDKSGGITPANLLHVHKSGTPANSSTLIQLSDDGTGAASTDGVQIGLDSVSSGFVTNKEANGKIRIGTSGTSNTTFESDGTMQFNGAATVWEDVRGSLISRTTSTAPTMALFGGSSTVYEWQFPEGASDKYLYCDIQLPHSYKEGSRIFPHIHWTPAASGSGNVAWKLDYEWVNIGDSYNGVSTTTLSVNAPATGVWTHEMSDFSTTGIDGTGMTISSILVCRIYRDGNSGADTYGGAASVIGFDVHYEINTIGSRTTTSK